MAFSKIFKKRVLDMANFSPIDINTLPNEIKNRLEQLRALENGIKINVALAKFCPIGIDTIEDYLDLKKILIYVKSNL